MTTNLNGDARHLPIRGRRQRQSEYPEMAGYCALCRCELPAWFEHTTSASAIFGMIADKPFGLATGR